jgi:predicted enzyme related to lactoylglutathione lyase
MSENEKISYAEFPSRDLDKTKAFFARAFGWSFTDYGPDYTSFSNQGLNGGFFKSDLCSSTKNGAALLVLYSGNLEGTLKNVQAAGGKLSKPVFSFPGGRRFHFVEPGGNELGVWSDVGG